MASLAFINLKKVLVSRVYEQVLSFLAFFWSVTQVDGRMYNKNSLFSTKLAGKKRKVSREFLLPRCTYIGTNDSVMELFPTRLLRALNVRQIGCL
jgi:hypothetical protein